MIIVQIKSWTRFQCINWHRSIRFHSFLGSRCPLWSSSLHCWRSRSSCSWWICARTPLSWGLRWICGNLLGFLCSARLWKGNLSFFQVGSPQGLLTQTFLDAKQRTGRPCRLGGPAREGRLLGSRYSNQTEKWGLFPRRIVAQVR